MGKSTCCVSKRARVQIPRTNVKARCGNTPLSPVLWELETRDLLRFTGHQPSGRLSERPCLKEYLMSSSGLHVHMACAHTQMFFFNPFEQANLEA